MRLPSYFLETLHSVPTRKTIYRSVWELFNWWNMTFTISKLPPSIYLPQYQNNSLCNWKERLNIIGRCVRSNTHLNRCGQTNLLKLNLFEEKYDTKKFVTIGHNKNIILIPRGYFLYFLKNEFFNISNLSMIISFEMK